jgi:pyruvate,water dikinase
LAQDYLAGRLPVVAQMAVAIFMHQYGMRGPGEIDIGRPRWREAPEPLMQVLQSYLVIDDTAAAPDRVFARGVAHAGEAAQQLEAAVAALPRGRVKARLVRWAVARYRALAGMREAPKFFAVRMLGIVRQGLLDSGAALAAAGLLQQVDDLFFLKVRELQEIAARRELGPALRATIAERRAVRAHEMRRKQLPRVLLSDGVAYYEGVRSQAAPVEGAETLAGDPVSPGVAEGVVHIVFSPNGVQLAPGEILVCPGTDPAWTPLFLAAGGLVTEVGGMMTHGSVVAREYGIPAVVGVHEATSRLHSGQRVRVDGMAGVVTVLEP